MLITYHLPPTVTELRRPQLLVGAERVSPIEISANESGRQIAIFASSVGKPPYAVSFGPFLGSTNTTTTLSFSVDGLPDIAALVPGHPARAASVRTLGGDPELLNGVEFGVNQDGRAWLALVLVGSWLDHSLQSSGDAEPPTWRIRDKTGRELPMVFSEHYYKKDDAGRVSPNATKIAVVYDSNLDLSNLTVELGTQGVILDSPWIVRFR